MKEPMLLAVVHQLLIQPVRIRPQQNRGDLDAPKVHTLSGTLPFVEESHARLTPPSRELLLDKNFLHYSLKHLTIH